MPALNLQPTFSMRRLNSMRQPIMNAGIGQSARQRIEMRHDAQLGPPFAYGTSILGLTVILSHPVNWARDHFGVWNSLCTGKKRKVIETHAVSPVRYFAGAKYAK